MTERNAPSDLDERPPRHADGAFDPNHGCEFCSPPLLAMSPPTTHRSTAADMLDPPHEQARQAAGGDIA